MLQEHTLFIDVAIPKNSNVEIKKIGKSYKIPRFINRYHKNLEERISNCLNLKQVIIVQLQTIAWLDTS